MDYTHISEDDQLSLLEDRARQYEAEHFNHSVNRDLLATTKGDDVPHALAQTDDAMATLDDAHAKVTKMIAKLKGARKAKGQPKDQ